MFTLQDWCDCLIDNACTILNKFFRLQISPLFPCTEKSDCLAQFPFQDEVLECSMTLLLGLNPTRFSQVTYSRIKDVLQYSIKDLTIPAIESKKYARTNILGIIYVLSALQDNWLKQDRPLVVTLTIEYPVKFHRHYYNKYILPNFPDSTL